MKKILPLLFFILCNLLIIYSFHNFPIIHLFNFTYQSIISDSIFILGMIVAFVSLITLVFKRTTVLPNKKSQHLITTGLYKYSRHPMYLGILIVIIGLWLNYASLTGLIIIIIFYLINNYYFINQEEKYLIKQFKDEYLIYQTKVRKWF